MRHTPPTHPDRPTPAVTAVRAVLRTAAALAVCVTALPSAATAWCLSPAAAATAAPTPVVAQAEADELDELDELVFETSAAYDEALEKQASLADDIDELDRRIEELERELPGQQAASDESLCALYKYSYDTSSVVMLILDSTSITEMLAVIDQYTWVLEYNLSVVAETARMKDELAASRESLEADKTAADEAAAEAASALESAQAAREQAQKEALARQKAEEEAAAEAAASAKQAEKSATASSQSSASRVNWSADKTAFVDTWASRIDAYLAGSSMAGCGEAYAEAAWEYGTDPRWAPAISAVESTKGAYCFASYNAWGYGSSGFASWEDGIRTVVAALGSSTYGGYLTRAAAKVYCPDNANAWYTKVAAEMAKI